MEHYSRPDQHYKDRYDQMSIYLCKNLERAFYEKVARQKNINQSEVNEQALRLLYEWRLLFEKGKRWENTST